MPRWPKRKTRPRVNEYGRTPLWEFALAGNVEELKRELAGGANVNEGDDAGYTPLHVAVQEWHVPVVEALIQAGADPNATDAHGNGPLWTAVMNARGDNRLVELLLQSGAEPQHENRHGHSPMDMALTIRNGLEEPFSSL